MNNKLMQLLGGLALAVLVVLIWRGDNAASSTVQDVFGWVGSNFQQAVSKVSDFVGSF